MTGTARMSADELARELKLERRTSTLRGPWAVPVPLITLTRAGAGLFLRIGLCQFRTNHNFPTRLFSVRRAESLEKSVTLGEQVSRNGK